MIKPTSFILNNFDKNKLLHIIYYIKTKYNKNSIIYGSTGFCTKAADAVSQTLKEDIFYRILNEEEASEIGRIGVYKGTPVYCVPELNEINAFVVPDWGNYFENKKENE